MRGINGYCKRSKPKKSYNWYKILGTSLWLRFFFLNGCTIFDYLALKEKVIQRGQTCLFAFLASMAFYTRAKSMQWPLGNFFFFFSFCFFRVGRKLSKVVKGKWDLYILTKKETFINIL